uniref:Uncharacterized protein n=1 Tax=Sphaerodactylus townsendi TaxID=933632 RepID=A0ACB8EUT0_9SAUR
MLEGTELAHMKPLMMTGYESYFQSKRNLLPCSGRHRDLAPPSTPTPQCLRFLLRKLWLMDYLEVNRDVIREVGSVVKNPVLLTGPLTSSMEPWKEKEQKLKKKLKKILPIDVHQPNPLGSLLSQPADALVSSFCLEAVSPDQQSFDKALKNVTTLLKPGGHFLMIGALEESFYLAGEAKLMVVPVSEGHVQEAFTKNGYHIRNFRSYTMPPSLKIGVDDVQGIFFIHAQKST